ncbi:fumarylacetoacetate hydrolase family protein [Pseudomonas sp. UBA2684]|uniref:fumarylacetoacetate hydrolase family protein n=1 Tax=Pseudomonas sp. UBA2684 TaxID=1947311 RepID=UPI000E84EF95|nr:fumarylacetoacetate hydrolase family protein [Pseudomonas sp. UBA2684]HBX55706.1 hydrolase [Pseudomonas sp.]|tara:strand:+ start:7643 stop:8527 length:885 start_codon:yes stop_codon:yes gene_type:complete
MRLARVEFAGEAFWASLESASGPLRRIRAPFAEWAAVLALQGIAALDLADERIELADCQLLPPLQPGARVFGVGLNYLSHLQRLGSPAPAHTLAYLKPDSALIGPFDAIQYPLLTAELDYEIELVAVVARPLLDEPQASSCLLGYTVGNDISARDAGRQIGRLDLLTQKAMDRTTPLGPWIVTLDELGGAGQPELEMSLSVNGEQRQQDNTRNMLFPIDELLNYLDARIALRAGDLLFTGSSHGVGLESGRFLEPGDWVEAQIQGIGQLRNCVGAPRRLHPAREVGRLGLPASQ